MARKVATKKHLHLCENIEDLDKLLENHELKDKKAEMLCKSANILFIGAEKEYASGDEEKAYVLYMRYLRVVSHLRNTNDYVINKKYYNGMLGINKPLKAMDTAEKLKESLILRFNAAKKEKKLKDIEDQEKFKQKIISDRNKVIKIQPQISKTTPNIILGLDKNEISCVLLFSLINNTALKQRVLIVDVRPSKDFMESHMVFANCLNVPEEIIVAGLSARSLELKFPKEVRSVWKTRTSKDIIVMVDWSSWHVVSGSALQVFNTAITKYDLDVKYEQAPLLLEGGYEGWLLHYPSYTSNPSVTLPRKNVIDENFLQEVDYPDEILDLSIYDDTETPKLNTNPMIDRSSKAKAIQVYSEIANKMQQIKEDQVKLADTSLNVEKERVEAEKDWESTQLKQEVMEETEEERDEIQLRSQEILSKILQLENKQRDVALERQVLYDKYEAYKRKQTEITKKLEDRKSSEQDPKIVDDKFDVPTSKENAVSDDIDPDDSYEEISKRLADEELEKEQQILASEAKMVALDRERLELEETREKKLAEAREKKKPVYKTDSEEGDSYDTSLNDNESMTINRSFSTPYINQVTDQDEVVVNHEVPHFDRAAKPSTRIPITQISPKTRDFQGVYGSYGKGLTGLKNLGNTCYMNSIIQCLSNTAVLSTYFLNDEYRKHVNRSQTTQGAIAEEVAAVVKTLWSGQFKSIATRDLRNVIGKHQVMFRGFEQQDSHEFLTILMDWLHDDLQSPSIQTIHKDSLPPSEKAWHEYTKAKESLILRLFYGQTKSTVSCKMCGKESVTYESFSNLSLELPGNTNKCTLSDCLKLYLHGETIAGWNCPTCKEKRDACKKLDISRLPPVLVIHFKRFYLDSKEYLSNMYRKKQTYIDFPLQDFSLKTENGHNQTYNLFGVSNHYGSMEGGHYTAYCRSNVYSKWFKFDDHIVTEISHSDVKSSAAYILFYTCSMSGT